LKKEYISLNSCLKRLIIIPPNSGKPVLIYLYDKLFKNPSFLKKSKNKKALQQIPKGLKLSGSPYWAGSELLREIYQ
jgi:hypothetical protein